VGGGGLLQRSRGDQRLLRAGHGLAGCGSSAAH